jgi:hypothetical protein
MIGNDTLSLLLYVYSRQRCRSRLLQFVILKPTPCFRLDTVLVSRSPQDTPPILEAVILKRHLRRLRYLVGVSNEHA